MTHPIRSLAARITLLVFAASVVSSVAVSWISIQSLDRFLRQKIDQRFPEVVNRISVELDQWYTVRARELSVFAASDILKDSAADLADRGRKGERARAEVEQYLRYVLERFPQFSRLAVAHEGEAPLVDVGRGQSLPAALLADLTPGTESLSISGAVSIGDRLAQVASLPLYDSRGRSSARLFAIIDLDLLQPILKSDELGKTARVFLIDSDQRFVNPPDGVIAGARYAGPIADAEESPSTLPTVTHYDDLLEDRVISTRKNFARFGWTIVLEQPYADALAPVMSSISRVAGLNLIIILSVAFVALRLAGSIVQPLRALSTAAKRLSEGERDVEIEETPFASEEVNLLTRTFNDMIRALDRNAREIEKSHKATAVANAELLATNEELSTINTVLEQLAITDGLTKLHNHRYFQEAIFKECKRSRRTNAPLCLILIDIDYFKKWNDRLGHAGGDEILRRIAEVLNQAVRETDILTRYGGEEFALIAINTELDGAAALAEKIRQAVEETQFLTDVPSEREQLTVSVGVAAFRGSRSALFSDADSALYSAKDAGRNRVTVAEPTVDEPERGDAEGSTAN